MLTQSRHLFSLFLSLVLAVSLLQSHQKPPAEAVLTGYVDQPGEEYMLVEQPGGQPVAVLRGDGFSNDNFARFVGERIRVRGRLETNRNPPILHVQRLDSIEQLKTP